MRRTTRVTVAEGCSLRDLRYLLDHLRPEDVEELAHTKADRRQVEQVCQASKHVATFAFDYRPAFCFGLYRVGHVGHIWGFGTTDTRRVMPSITRFVRRVYFPHLFEHTGLRRIEVRVPTTSVHSVDWLMKLGAQIESVVHDHLPSGQPAFQLAYTTRDFQRDFPECVIPYQQDLQSPVHSAA